MEIKLEIGRDDERDDFSFTYRVTDEQPDIPFHVSFEIEGHKHKELRVKIESDNPNAMKVVTDSDEPRTGILKVGTPNPDGSPAKANIICSIHKGHHLLKSFKATFIVSHVPGPPVKLILTPGIPVSQ